MTERLTPSELVYLFVDGEATGAERTQMYAALATDNDLQAEFEDALRLKQTVDDEIAAAVPPMETTKELFLRAGFTLPLPIAGSEALAPAVSHIADSGIFTALKSFIAPFLMTTGIVVTGIASLPIFERIETAPAATTTTTANRAQEQQVNSGQTNSQMLSNNASLPAAPITTVPTKAATTVSGKVRPRGQAYFNINELRNDVPKYGTPSDEPTPVHNYDLSTPLPQAVADTKTTKAEEAPRQISSGTEDRTLDDMIKTPVTQPNDFWFGLRGITGLALYPSRTSDGAKDLRFNNIAMSAEYLVTPTSRIGLAAGTETFPHYTVNTTDTSLSEKWNIVWAGASYSFTAFDLALGPLVPSATLLVGGAATGPLGKLSAGLSWQPDERVSFAAGIESTLLGYHYSSTWHWAGKLGATYSVAVRF